MGLKIVAQGRSRELPDEAADELIRRLGQGGLIEINLETGHVISGSPMADLGERLGGARESDIVYSPAEDEQGILFVVVDTWLQDVNTTHFPAPVAELRYALFSDIDNRRRHIADARS